MEQKDITCYPKILDKKNGNVYYRNTCKQCRNAQKTACLTPEARKRDKDIALARKQSDPVKFMNVAREATRKHYEKNKHDPYYLLGLRLKRQCLRDVFNKDETKQLVLTGCKCEIVRRWFEFNYEVDMNKDNHTELWEVDHVIPVSMFDLNDNEQKLKCFHWTNLRPVYSAVNKKKSNKLLPSYVQQHVTKLENFLKEYPEYQTSLENSWWRTFQVRYGNNLANDDDEFVHLLKSTIRNEARCLLQTT